MTMCLALNYMHTQSIFRKYMYLDIIKKISVPVECRSQQDYWCVTLQRCSPHQSGDRPGGSTSVAFSPTPLEHKIFQKRTGHVSWRTWPLFKMISIQVHIKMSGPGTLPRQWKQGIVWQRGGHRKTDPLELSWGPPVTTLWSVLKSSCPLLTSPPTSGTPSGNFQSILFPETTNFQINMSHLQTIIFMNTVVKLL